MMEIPRMSEAMTAAEKSAAAQIAEWRERGNKAPDERRLGVDLNLDHLQDMELSEVLGVVKIAMNQMLRKATEIGMPATELTFELDEAARKLSVDLWAKTASARRGEEYVRAGGFGGPL
jgi:hypothetical protein